MGKHLVIVESPNKINKIKSFLGSQYEVVASVGHIRDLPSKKLGVNIRKQFEPTYEVYPDKKDVVQNIVKKAKTADTVFILTDLDREGEGIAKHIIDLLPPKAKYKRAISSSITKTAIVDAIANAGGINEDLVESYECRRILDRLVGYKCSYITKQATGGTSAGRVQSAALRIIAEREKEIRSFIPEEYWPISAELLTDKFEKIVADIKKPKPLEIKTGAEAKKICETLKSEPVKVSKFEKKNVSVKPFAPFTTSTLLQSSAAVFGWKPDRTMSIAQKMYEAGSITYHRTDSVHIVPDFVAQVRSHVGSNFNAAYLPASARMYKASSKAQEAHEAIRVTDLSMTSVSDSDQNKLYQMIWKRTVSSQMSDMEQERKTAEFICKTYVLGASGSRVIFDGWRKVWTYGAVIDKDLPDLTVGDNVKVIDVKTEQKFTEPPPRYSTTSIVKELEKRGIGRPSTYANILKTIEDRKYVQTSKRNLQASDLGIIVSDFLQSADFCFIDLGFTADMENKLDDIANKKANKVQVLTDFWKRLKDDIENAKKQKEAASRTSFTCPDCSGALLKKHSRYGAFYSCENYKNKDKPCKYIANLGDDDKPVAKVKAQIKESQHKCPKCGELLLIRQGKKGEYLGCRNWQKKDCKGFYDTDGKLIEFKKKKFSKKK